MGRIVAIDYGSKRVGIAVTDLLQIIATPLETVHSKDVIVFLQALEARDGIDAFVIGMPKNLQNMDTDSSNQVRHFINLLKKKFPDKKIHTHDERFTSKMALQAMIAGGMKKKDRRDKSNIDKISAAIILQSFLESNASL